MAAPLRHALAILVVASSAPAACTKPAPARPPVTATSASASAGPSASASSVSSAPRASASSDSGDSAASGADAKGTWGCVDDVAIEIVPGYGNTAVRAPKMFVTMESPTGAAAEAPARTLCAQSARLRECFDDQHVAESVGAGLTVEVEVDERGKAQRTTKAMGNGDDKVFGCIAGLARAASFGAGQKRTLRIELFAPARTRMKGANLRTVDFASGPGLPTMVVRRILDSAAPRLRGCYVSARNARYDLEGTMELRFSIGRAGAPTDAKIVDATLVDAGLARCAIEAVNDLTFPEPDTGKPIAVRYRFELTWGD